MLKFFEKKNEGRIYKKKFITFFISGEICITNRKSVDIYG